MGEKNNQIPYNTLALSIVGWPILVVLSFLAASPSAFFLPDSIVVIVLVYAFGYLGYGLVFVRFSAVFAESESQRLGIVVWPAIVAVFSFQAAILILLFITDRFNAHYHN